MKISLNQKQMDFLQSKANNTGFVAGLGSGKSFVSTLKTIIKKVNFPNCTVAYYLPTYGLVRDIAFDKFPAMLSEMGYKYNLNKSDKEIHIQDFGKIIFRSMDNPENIVGYEVFYSLVDECDILLEDKMGIAYNKILARNRQVVHVDDIKVINEYVETNVLPKGTYLHDKLNILCWNNQMDIVGTPEGFKFFYKRYVTDFRESSDILIKASTYDNKHLPSTYIKQLEEQYPPNLLKAYLMGDFINLSTGTIFGYFDRLKHDTDIVENNTEALYLGQDWNISNCVSTVYIKRTIDGKQKLIQVDEIESYDTKAIITNLKNKYPNRSISIYPDASGNARKTSSSETDIQMLRQAGFMIYVNSRNPAVFDRITITNNCFDKDMVLVNCKRCPKTAKAYEQHSYDEKGQPMKFNGAGTVDDFTDSATYPLAYMFPINYEFRKIKISGI